MEKGRTFAIRFLKKEGLDEGKGGASSLRF